jgi:hypothetical protein
MADEKTRADSVRKYLTGASSDGGAQADHDLSLGNFRSSTEVEMLASSIASPISNITVEYISGANGPGTGTLTASGVNDLKWTPPGGTIGDAVTIANGETKIIEAGNSEPTKYVRVTRTTADDLTGTATITLTEKLNNVVGFDDVSSAEATAGDIEYRCLAIKNESSASVTNVKAHLDVLGTQRTTDSAQLPASGAGTITTTGSFADWPAVGFAQVKTSGGSEREVVYYSSRTATSLTVPAAGREMLGTTAAAGAADDTVDAIPGVSIGLDAPTSQTAGSFVDQTGAGEGAAPAGVSFSNPSVEGDALSIGTLLTGEIYGIWFRREKPATAVSERDVVNRFQLLFDAA